MQTHRVREKPLMMAVDDEAAGAAQVRRRSARRPGRSRPRRVDVCVVFFALLLGAASALAEPVESEGGGAPVEVAPEAPADAQPGGASPGPEPSYATFEAPSGEFRRLLPEWEYAPGEDWNKAKRVGGRSAKVGWDFVNDTVSDSWYTLSSPIRWRWKEWLIVGAAAGTTTGLIFLADEPLRDAARKSERFYEYGENVRWVGQGGALGGLTGGLLLTGLVFDRPQDYETVKLLLESALIGHGYGLAMKYSAGRYRPRTDRSARSFDPFSGNVSMPSGEALNVFLLAGVMAERYPNWPVRILSYGTAAAVGAGRIALDAHWGSDIFVSAVIGIAVSKTVVKLNAIRARDRELRKRLELSGDATPSLRKPKLRHYLAATSRSVRWTVVF